MLPLSYVINDQRKARESNAGDERKPPAWRPEAVPGLRGFPAVLLALACALALLL